MIVQVRRLRSRGIRTSGPTTADVSGDLHVDEMPQSAFGRATRVARLLHPTRPQSAAELLPPLFDVQLLMIADRKMVIAGIERESVEGQLTDYAQTWLVLVESPPSCGTLGAATISAPAR